MNNKVVWLRCVIVVLVCAALPACSGLRVPSAAEVAALFKKSQVDLVQSHEPAPVANENQPWLTVMKTQQVTIGSGPKLINKIQGATDRLYFLINTDLGQSNIEAVSQSMFSLEEIKPHHEVLWGSSSLGIFVPAFDHFLDGVRPSTCSSMSKAQLAELIYHPCRSNSEIWRKSKILSYFDGVDNSAVDRLGLKKLDYAAAWLAYRDYKDRVERQISLARSKLTEQAANAYIKLSARDESGFLDSRRTSEVEGLLEQAVSVRIKGAALPGVPTRYWFATKELTAQKQVLENLESIVSGRAPNPTNFYVDIQPGAVGVGMLAIKFDNQAVTIAKKSQSLQYRSNVIVTGVKMIDRPLFDVTRSDSTLSVKVDSKGNATLTNLGAVSLSVSDGSVEYGDVHTEVHGPGLIAPGKSVAWDLFRGVNAGSSYSGIRECTLKEAHSSIVEFEVRISYTSESGAKRVLSFAEGRPFLDVSKFSGVIEKL